MMFRISGLTLVMLLFVAGVTPAGAQAAIYIGDEGALSNGRQTASIDVGFTCEHPSAYRYAVTVNISQPSGRTMAEGVKLIQDSCASGDAINLTVSVDSVGAPFKPGPATVIVDLERIFDDGGGYDSDKSHATATVNFKGGNGGSPANSQSDIFISSGGTLSNGRQTATIDIGFTCDHPESYRYDLNVNIIQPSGQNLAEGVAYAGSPCVAGESVSLSIPVDTTTTAFKPGPATVSVDLTRTHCCYDSVETHASATVNFKG